MISVLFVLKKGYTSRLSPKQKYELRSVSVANQQSSLPLIISLPPNCFLAQKTQQTRNIHPHILRSCHISVYFFLSFYIFFHHGFSSIAASPSSSAVVDHDKRTAAALCFCNTWNSRIAPQSPDDTLTWFCTKPPNKLPFHHNVTLTVSLTVGSPPQNVTMVLDTGSELSWLHCKKNPNLHSIFNPLLSSSYSPIPCSSLACKTRTKTLLQPVSCDPNKLCHATVSYADASSNEGNLASETFYIGNSSRPGTIFGCMDSGFSSNSEEDSKTTGLMGLNRGSLSFISQMGLPKFSYCISGSDSSGVLLFGEASFTWLRHLNYTPLVQISDPLPYFDRVAYTVQLEGIKVSAKILALPKSVFVPDHTGAGQTMVDSGTQFTFLLGPVYTALKNEFIKQTKGILSPLDDPNFVFQGAMDLCFGVASSGRSLPQLPAVTLMFRGAEMVVSGERLIYRVPEMVRGGKSVYCFTFGNSDLLGMEAFVIGHHHQQNLWMEFDLVNSRVGLAEVRCALASQRLGLDL